LAHRGWFLQFSLPLFHYFGYLYILAGEPFHNGEGAVSKAVEDVLNNVMNLTTDRIAGSNRFDTAGEVARRMQTDGTYSNKVIVANGLDFPDALAASAYAARLGYPIILCTDSRIPNPSQSALTDLAPEASYVVGGTGVISDGVMAQLINPERIFGNNRYATATELATFFQPSNARYYVATGSEFADAIAGGVLAAKNDAGLLLVSKIVPEVVESYINENNVQKATIFGGTGAVSEEIEQELTAWLQQVEVTFEVTFTVTDENSVPIEGARIYVDRGDYSDYGFTDSSGDLTLNLPAGDYDYYVSADGFFGTSGQFSNSGDSALSIVLDLLYEVTFEVTFFVTDENSVPIEGARIYVDRGDYWVLGFTNSSGDLTLNLPAGDYYYNVRADGFLRTDGQFSVSGDSALSIIVLGQNYEVTFTVRDENSDPIEDAEINVSSGDYWDFGFTDSSGKKTLNLPEGDCQYTVRADGFSYSHGEFSVSSDAELNIVLESVGPLYEVTFTVTDENSDPIKDAWVYADREDYEASGYTDSSGDLTLNLPEGDYYYNVSADGFSYSHGEFSVSSDAELNIVLERLYEVTFTVRDENTDPIAGARIYVDRGDYSASGYTDSSGNLTLNLPAGDYDYEVSADGFFYSHGEFSVSSDTELDIVLVIPSQLYEVVCSVTDEDGNPIEEALVTVYKDDYSDFGYTDSLGNLTLNLPAGDYDYNVRADGFFDSHGEFSVPSDAELDIVLDTPDQLYEVTFFVIDEDGTPQQGASVYAYKSDFRASGYTDSAGKLTVYLPEGNYSYTINPVDYFYNTGGFSVTGNVEVNVVVR
jgi:putative cell wall-binding protein